jgi:hypothetical protein
MIRFLAFFAFIFVSISAVAQQNSGLSLDSTSNSVLVTMPFDQMFPLYIRGANTGSIKSAFFIKWKIRNGKRVLSERRDGSLKMISVLSNNVFKTSNGIGLNVPALQPNRSFAILLSHRFDGDLLNLLYEVNYNLLGNNPKSDVLLRSVERRIENKVKLIPGVDSHGMDLLKNVTTFNSKQNLYPSLTNFPEYYNTFFRDSLREDYEILEKSLIYSVLDQINSVNIGALLSRLSAAKTTSLDLSNLINQISRGRLIELQYGTIGLDLNSGLCKPYELHKRVDNLVKTDESLKKIVLLLNNVLYEFRDVEMSRLKGDLLVLSTNVQFNKGLLDKLILRLKTKFEEQDERLNYVSWYIGDTQLFDLKTKGSYIIIPTFGIVNIFGIGNYKYTNIVRPFLGASIHLRPVDKTIPISSIKHKFLHRVAFNFGITVGKIEKGEFSDFYNSASILLGGTYRFYNELSISFGTALVNRDNRNFAIDSPRISFNPYVGIAFDVDFMNTLQKITGKIF